MTYIVGYELVAPQTALSNVESGLVSGATDVVPPTPGGGGFGYTISSIGNGFMDVHEQMCTADILAMSEVCTFPEDVKKAVSLAPDEGAFGRTEIALINPELHEVDDSFARAEVQLIAYDILAALADSFDRAEEVVITNS